jgi:5'-3' exonuclease
MKTLNIILDFNNLAMRSLFACQYMSDSDVKGFDTDEECGVLARKIVTDICYVMNAFAADRIILACDSKYPWRHDIYKDIDGQSYKGNRIKDEEKNWDNIFSTFDDIRNILSDKGVVVSFIDRAEADDVAAMWKNKLFNEDKENVILVSSDRDWTQLVDFDQEHSCYCICYNPISNNKGKRNLYLTNSMSIWLNEPTQTDIFFNNYSHEKTNLKKVIDNDPKIDCNIIDPTNVIIEKIMCGDDGDNVPTFFEYYKNGRKMRVTPLKTKHIVEALNIFDVEQLVVYSNNGMLKEHLEKEMKYTIDIDFPERLERQRKLVELNITFFPDVIINLFNEHIDVVSSNGYTTNIPKNMQEMLSGSKYISKNFHKSKENSIFASLNLDKYSKQHILF